MNSYRTAIVIGIAISNIAFANAQCDSIIITCIKSVASAQGDPTLVSPQVCSNMGGIESCIMNANCLYGNTQLEWNGLKDGYNYLCGDGKKAFTDSASCISSKSDSIGTCAISYGQSVLNNPSGMCSYTQTFYTCIDISLFPCGSAAVNVYHTFNYKSSAPLLASVGCTVSQYPASASGISASMYLIIVLGLVLLFTRE